MGPFNFFSFQIWSDPDVGGYYVGVDQGESHSYNLGYLPGKCFLLCGSRGGAWEIHTVPLDLHAIACKWTLGLGILRGTSKKLPLALGNIIIVQKSCTAD